MLVYELSEFMSIEDYCNFKKYLEENKILNKYVTLPDGRILDWHDDYDVHEFMKLKDSVIRIHGPSDLGKPNEPRNPSNT